MNHKTYSGRTITTPHPVTPVHRYTIGHYWDNLGTTLLTDIPKDPKVVLIGPAEAHPTFPMVYFSPNADLYPAKETFRADLQTLRAHGKTVYLVLDGKDDLVIDQRTANQFATECQDFLSAYGFDGLALRVSSIPSSDYLVNALSQLSAFKIAFVSPAAPLALEKTRNFLYAASPYLSLVVAEFGANPVTPHFVSYTVDALSDIIGANKVMLSFNSDPSSPGFVPAPTFYDIWDCIVRGLTTPYAFNGHWDLGGICTTSPSDYSDDLTSYVLGVSRPIQIPSSFTISVSI